MVQSHTEIFYDRWFRFFRTPPIHDNRIVVVGIQNAEIKDHWAKHQQVLNTLIDDGAKVIGLDFFMTHVPEKINLSHQFKNLVLPVYHDVTQTLTGKAIINPYKGLSHDYHRGNITLLSATDGLTRQIEPLIHEKGRTYPAFSTVLAHLAIHDSVENSQPFIQSHTLIWDQLKISLDQYELLRVNYRDFELDYPILPYQQVLNGQFKPSTFKDKIVLIGITDAMAGTDNLIRTPLNNTSFFSVVFQAQLLSNILNHRTLGFIPNGLMHFFIILVAFSASFSFNRVKKPLNRVWMFVVFFLTLLVFALTALFVFQRILPAFEIFVMLVFCFFLSSTFNLQRANKELQQLNITLEDKVNQRTSALKETNEKLQQLQQMKEELIKMVVHDLKNPLTSIMGSLELLMLDNKAMSPEQLELIEMAFVNSERLRQMIQNMLDISKMESNKLELQNELVNLPDLIQVALKSFQSVAQKEGKNLIFGSHEPVAVIWADPYLIQRVIFNLLTNAFKYTDHGDKITIELHKKGEYIQIKVMDTGLGIPAEFHQKIFEKFEQVNLKSHQRQMSTGLGLAFCKMVIELHQGIIWVESQLNQGSTFICQLPLVEEDVQSMFVKDEPHESYSHR